MSPEFAEAVEAGRPIPSFFELSSADKRQPAPRLSVWVEALTTVAEAWRLVGADPRRSWVVFLEADAVRQVAVRTDDGSPAVPPLDIQWERAMTVDEAGQRIPEARPGAEGHAGIVNLDKGNKTQREVLRRRLANIVTVRILDAADLARFGTA